MTLLASTTTVRGIRIAVEGCGHGTLKAIYASVAKSCEAKGWPGVDLLIIGGDFQAVRNTQDMNCIAMPAKYRELGDFQLYYSGVEQAPYLTIFVGGNHEASNHNFELYYGGWAAPNIYFMGAANVLRLGPLRIAGLSGIWKGYNYRKPHYERLPYNDDDLRNIYHVREYDVRKMLQISSQIDIGISHDWPQGVEWLGNYRWLFSKKDLFEGDARSGRLGSVAAKLVMQRLRPPYWFSAHLHIKYAAVVDHEGPYPEMGPVNTQGLTKGINFVGANDRKQQLDNESADSEITASTLMASNGVNTARTDSNEIDLGMDGTTDLADDVVGTLVGTSKNTDEIDLDLDDEILSNEPTAAVGHARPAMNADEIELTSNGSGDALNPNSISQAAAVEDAEEIDLDLDDAPSNKPTNTTAAEDVSEELRALLPASFSKPVALPEPPTTITNTTTKFLALDKCLPNRHFLQLLSIPYPEHIDIDMSSVDFSEPLQLHYDPEWLAITRVFANELPVAPANSAIASDLGRGHYAPLIAKERDWIDLHIALQGKLRIPHNFVRTAPPHDPSTASQNANQMPREYSNPQTEAFCDLLQIPNPFKVSEAEIEARMQAGPAPVEPRQNGGFKGGRGGRGGGGLRGRGGGGRGGRGGGGGGGRGRGRGRW